MPTEDDCTCARYFIGWHAGSTDVDPSCPCHGFGTDYWDFNMARIKARAMARQMISAWEDSRE